MKSRESLARGTETMVRLYEALDDADHVQFNEDNTEMFVQHGCNVAKYAVSDWEIMDIIATATLDMKLTEV